MRSDFRPAALERGRSASCSFAGLDALEELNRRELVAVRWFARANRSPLLASSALALSRLGSGWLYLLLSALVAGTSGWYALWKIGSVTALSVAVCFSVYAVLKPNVGRARPYRRDPSLARMAGALDRYAFPSGHSMTAAAVGIVLARAVPDASLLFVGLWLSISWSRVVLGHHYPSDVLAGGALGALVSSNLTPVLL